MIWNKVLKTVFVLLIVSMLVEAILTYGRWAVGLAPALGWEETGIRITIVVALGTLWRWVDADERQQVRDEETRAYEKETLALLRRIAEARPQRKKN